MTAIAQGEPTDRQRALLVALCRGYLLVGRPVSSLQLSQTHGLRWSSATIRAELGALEELGLLEQPHSASGRVPTAAGLRMFITGLPPAHGPAEGQREALDRAVARAPSPQRGVRASAQLLSDFAGGVGIGFLGHTRRATVRDVTAIAIGPTRTALTLTFAEDRGHDRAHAAHAELEPAIEVVEHTPLGEAGLRELKDRLRDLVVGRTLDEAGEHLRSLLGELEARVDSAIARVLAVAIRLCEAAELDPLWMQVSGAPALVRELNGALGASATELGQVLGVLEHNHLLASVLCQLLGPPGDGEDMRVQVHLDVRLPDVDRARGLSVVGCRIPGEAGAANATGAVAVLGTARMDYEAVIPLVDYVAKALAQRATGGPASRT